MKAPLVSAGVLTCLMVAAHAAGIAITFGPEIRLVDPAAAGGLVDWSGSPSAAPVGSAWDIDWDPSTGELVAFSGNQLYRNDGTGWIGSTLALPPGPSPDLTSDLAVSSSGRMAITLGTQIYLVDTTVAGGIVDWAGNPTSSPVGSAPAIDWDPSTGDLVAFGGNTIYRNGGAGWTGFSISTSIGAPDLASDIAVGMNGRIAVTSPVGIYLIDEGAPGGVVDWAGNPSTSSIGSAADIEWDPLTGDLVALLGTSLWRRNNSGWTSVALNLPGPASFDSNLTIIQIPEPATPLIVASLALVASVRRRRDAQS